MHLSKKHWVYLIVTFGFIAQVFLSQILWYSETRDFFLVPMFDALPLDLGDIGNMVLFIGLLLSLIIGVFYQKKHLLFGILLFLALLFLQDLSRVQAWSYQYFLTFLVLFISWKKPTKEILPALQYLLIFTYFWSGIQKINPHYIDSVHPWLFNAFEWSKPFKHNVTIGYATAIMEVLIGVGLMFRATQKIAVILGILMHGLILAMISPWFLNWNSVVYPWNIVMICLLPILFWNRKHKMSESENESENSLNEKLPQFAIRPKSPVEWLILVCVGILPVFNLFTHFPETISMTMYNGATSQITVFFAEDEMPNCIPQKAKSEVYPALNGNLLSLDDWGVQELNVPIYNLPTYARKFGKQYCDCVENKALAGIRITNIKRWRTKDAKIVEWISCQDLK
jgi:hypothetical protein